MPVKANSAIFVLATITLPAARSRRTTVASAKAGGASARILEPARVGSPATSNKSLMLTMMPSRGPSEMPARARASAASAALRAACEYTVRQARAPSPLESAIRASASSNRSRAERIGTFLAGAGTWPGMIDGAANSVAVAAAPVSNLRRLTPLCARANSPSTPLRVKSCLTRRCICCSDLLAQQRDRFEIRRLRDRLQIGVDVDQFRIGKHLGRVGRHVAACRAHPSLQSGPRQRNRIGYPWSFASALALMTMAL